MHVSRWSSSCTKLSSQPIMCPCGHQCSQYGWSASDTSTLRKPCARAPGRRAAEVREQLVLALGVEHERALGAVDLPAHLVLAPGCEARRLERAVGAVLELDRGLEGVVDVDGAARPLGDERLRQAREVLGLADEVARLVDDVRAEIAERPGSGLLLVEPPDLRELRIHDPLLVVARAEVVDLAELAGLDQLLGEDDRRIEAVVERRHVLDARGRDLPPDLVALVGVAAERLLADDVLARLGRRDRRLEVGVVGPAVVEDLHVGIGDDVFPAGRVLLVAVAARGLAHRLLGAARDRDEPRDVRRRPGHVRDLLERVRVRAPHERVAEHADADLGDGVVAGPLVAHRDEADLLLLAHASHHAWPGTSGFLMKSGLRNLMHCSQPSSSLMTGSSCSNESTKS